MPNSVENVWRVPELFVERCQAMQADRECSQKVCYLGQPHYKYPSLGQASVARGLDLVAWKYAAM